MSMLSDGNCMFRSIAHQVVGDASKHLSLRHTVVNFSAMNVEALKGYYCDKEISINSHFDRMQNAGCWGTQLEIKATATLFQIPVYVLTDSLIVGEWKWTCFQPLSEVPAPPRDILGTEWAQTHCKWIEICHSSSCHYDSITFTASSVSPHSPPCLSTSQIFIDLE